MKSIFKREEWGKRKKEEKRKEKTKKGKKGKKRREKGRKLGIGPFDSPKIPKKNRRNSKTFQG